MPRGLCIHQLYGHTHVSHVPRSSDTDRIITTSKDASVSTSLIIPDPYAGEHVAYVCTGHASTPGLEPAGTFGPGISHWTATNDPVNPMPFESLFVVEVLHDTPFTLTPPLRGFGRYGLIDSRAAHVVSPQTQQLPLRVTAMCVGGRDMPPPDGVEGSVGQWCYDEEGTNGLLELVNQSAEAGFELFILGQNMNATWRSEVANEFQISADGSKVCADCFVHVTNEVTKFALTLVYCVVVLLNFTILSCFAEYE